MLRSNKLALIGIIILLTAFPLGSININLLLFSLFGCAFFMMWYLCEYHFEECQDEENRIKKENEEYYQKMKSGVELN